MKNYYQILGVKQTATESEIKRSYRVLAKRYHPDVNPGDAHAADKFADINEAHTVLSDAKSRAEYDVKLREALSPQMRPEDIIARQRAAAQAAARQAAYAQHVMPNMAASMAAARAQAASRAQTASRARAQAAQSQVHPQMQDQNMQAQINAMRDKAFAEGKKVGAAEAKRTADRKIAQLEKELSELKAKNSELSAKENEVEHDRSDLEQELFSRDQELTRTRARCTELEEKLNNQHKSQAQQKANAKLTAEFNELKAKYEAAQERIQVLEHEKNKSELNYKAQLQLQQEKRRQLQNEIKELKRVSQDLTAEAETLRAENEQWQQYAKSEEFISDAEQRIQEWEKKQKADKKLARNTLYGTLGVLIWADDAEIETAYNKLVKRYSAKQDEASAEKLERINDAYAILSDASKRKQYNDSIGITEDRIADERRAILDNESIMNEYREQLDNKAFWQRFDELMFNAQTGDAEAENKLGEMYYYGDEIEQDLEQAVYWFKEAAKQKHADAMYNLGVCMVRGEGIDRNESTGLGFIRQAAKLGSKAAKQYRA